MPDNRKEATTPAQLLLEAVDLALKSEVRTSLQCHEATVVWHEQPSGSFYGAVSLLNRGFDLQGGRKRRFVPVPMR